MKPTRIFLLLVALLAPAGFIRAQTLELPLTNQVASFTDRQGHSYSSVHLVRATPDQLIFKINDMSYGTVALTNLSPDTLQEIGVTDDFLKKVEIRRKQQLELAQRSREIYADEQARLQNPTNLQTANIEGIFDRSYNAAYGYVYLCDLRLATGASVRAYVARIPASVSKYYQNVSVLEQATAQLDRQVESVSAQVDSANSFIRKNEYAIDMAQANPTGLALANPNVAQYIDLGFARADIRLAGDALKDLTNNLNDLKVQFNDSRTRLNNLKNNESVETQVWALVSQFTHQGGRLYVCAASQGQSGFSLAEPGTGN